MLRGLANDDGYGYVAPKRAAEGWRHTESMSKTCSTAEDY